MYNGYETWKIDEKRCAVYDAMNREGKRMRPLLQVLSLEPSATVLRRYSGIGTAT